MVRRASLCLIFFCLFLAVSQAAFAGSFTATVDRQSVPLGESFTLDLSLSGAAPKGAPDLSPLDKDFSVYATGQSSQTTIINGKVSSSRHWQITLLPKKEGVLTIPAITINTDEGKLATQAVSVNAVKAGGNTAAQDSRNSAVFVHTELSKDTPFVNEPVILAAKMVARRSVANITLPDVTADNVIIEQQGDPDIYDGVYQGERVKILEVRYLVTPLEAGAVKLPSLVFQGKVDTGQRQSPFAGQFSDPFGMFDDFGFTSYAPFAVSSDDVVLNVKPPAAAMDPWLPAFMVKLSDKWEGADNVKVGEPITRKITVIAEGQTATALPDLESRIDPNGDFKIYSDKPVTGESLAKDGQSIGGWREESFTLIAEKPGTYTLPEIRLAWWDVLDNKLAYASVPAKTIKVGGAPVAATSSPPQTTEITTEQQGDTKVPASQPVEIASPDGQPAIPPYIYIALVALGVLVVVMAAVLVYLFHRLARQNAAGGSGKAVKTRSAANEDKVSLAAINRAATAKDLHKIIRLYVHQHWGLPKNAALQTVAAAVKARHPKADVKAFSDLDAALYAGAQIDIGDVRSGIHEALKSVQGKGKVQVNSGRRLGNLNPS